MMMMKKIMMMMIGFEIKKIEPSNFFLNTSIENNLPCVSLLGFAQYFYTNEFCWCFLMRNLNLVFFFQHISLEALSILQVYSKIFRKVSVVIPRHTATRAVNAKVYLIRFGLNSFRLLSSSRIRKYML